MNHRPRVAERIAESDRGEAIRSRQTTTDLVKLYLKEIGRVRLLRHDEEVELARTVKQYVDALQARQDLQEKLGREPTADEWAKRLQVERSELMKLQHVGKQAKDAMLKANLRLVVSVAKKYQNRGVEFLDLIQEGTIGLQRAIEKFEPQKGYRFSTYAYWWIRQGVTRAVENYSRTIRIPSHVRTKLNQVKQAQQKYYQSEGRAPTLKEIAAELELTPMEVREILWGTLEATSLDVRVGDEGDKTLGDLLESDRPSSERDLIRTELKRDVRSMVGQLNAREQEILRKRYGLDDGRCRTFIEIGKEFNLSRERIRQIEARALKKLRQPEFCQNYRDYLEELE